MSIVSMKQLFDAGVHFGHIKEAWHPKMKPYIHSAHSGIYIINLQETFRKLQETYEVVKKLSSEGKKILFVGTKNQARESIEQYALASNNFYVKHRWLGGMLTNFSTVKQSISKLRFLETEHSNLLKKEIVRREKECRKIENVLCGIRNMRKMPGAIFIIDLQKEDIALKEAKKLNIPVIAVVDTNCDPTEVDYPIPGNDDSPNAIALFTSVIAAASVEGRQIYDKYLQEIKRNEEKQNAEKKKTQKDVKSKKANNVGEQTETVLEKNESLQDTSQASEPTASSEINKETTAAQSEVTIESNNSTVVDKKNDNNQEITE